MRWRWMRIGLVRERRILPLAGLFDGWDGSHPFLREKTSLSCCSLRDFYGLQLQTSLPLSKMTSHVFDVVRRYMGAMAGLIFRPL